MKDSASQVLPVDIAMQRAIQSCKAGKLQDAERLYRAVLESSPDNPDANHNLGVIAVQTGKPATGLAFLKAALETNPSVVQYWLSYINALVQQGELGAAGQVLQQGRQRGLHGMAADALEQQLTECTDLVDLFGQGLFLDAENRARDLIGRFNHHGFGWNVLGASLKAQGLIGEAAAAMRRAVELLPENAEANANLGVILKDLGCLEEANASFRHALKINPNYAKAHNDLGATLKDQGCLAEAEVSYRRALELEPDYAEALSNLGNVLRDMGRLGEAETSYRRALELKPDFPAILNNLAALLSVLGEAAQALDFVGRSMRIKDSASTRGTFVDCLKRLRVGDNVAPDRQLLLRAVSEPWGRPGELVQLAVPVVKQTQILGECIARAADGWPVRLPEQDLFGPCGLAAIATDELLLAMLTSAPVSDIALERFLTATRRCLLDRALGAQETAVACASSQCASDSLAGLYAALAQQCFINEYVFVVDDEEAKQVAALQNALDVALESDAMVPLLLPLVLAAYIPLYKFRHSERLLDQSWPAPVKAVLRQQILEPAEEMRLRPSILCLTAIDDEISMQVRQQYEENPYPRWVKAPPASNPTTLDVFMRRQLPLSPYRRLGKTGDIDILIAGCGTGQHALGTAQHFNGARVLAIDLSLSSLCYARRKTQEMGLQSIQYAQADLLKLGSISQRFDLIESSGVLHHLADPWAGWRVLLSLLRPGGVMRLGFYSALARQDIARVRDVIADRNYGNTAEDIRRCRQDLLNSDTGEGFGGLFKFPDFFSISECRDLLFHTQEHRLTLPDIKSFIDAHALKFLGFQIKSRALLAYRRRFPGDPAAVNLDHWQVFENENPDTFRGMYQFWVQKDCDKETSSEYYIGLGNSLKGQGRLDEAVDSYQQAILVNPECAVAHYNLANTLTALHRFREACDCYRQALAVKPGFVEAWFNLANTLSHQNLWDEAVAGYRQLLLIRPDYVQAHNNLGAVLREQGRLSEAVASYRQALLIKPDYAEAHNNLGAILRDQGLLNEAFDSLQMALSLRPDYAEACNNLGAVLRDQGRLDEAIKIIQKALVINPDFAEAYNSLGVTYYAQGRVEEAVASYQSAARLDPDNQSLAHLIRALTASTSERAPSQYVEKLFDGYAEKFDTHLVEVLQYKTPTELVGLIEQAITAPTDNWDVLDLGCGTGLVGQAVSTHVRRLVGVDISAKMLAKAQARNTYHKLVQSDLLPMMRDEAHSSYDVIIAADVFVYLGKLDEIFFEAKRLLRMGGVFAFSVESIDALPNQIANPENNLMYNLNQSGRYAHSSNYLKELASVNGFRFLKLISTQVRLEKGLAVQAWLALLEN